MAVIDGWLIVDDQQEERMAFADRISNPGAGIRVTPVSPSEARILLLSERNVPKGVLMDVHLSDAEGELGTGPGLAQDIRLKQRSKDIVGEYPIVRFSRKTILAVSVYGDPTSIDLFDLSVDKEEIQESVKLIHSAMLGAEVVYRELSRSKDGAVDLVRTITGLTAEQFEEWGHGSFARRMRDGLSTSVHVAALAIFSGLLEPAGLLIDQNLLKIRLGLNAEQTQDAWALLSTDLAEFGFRGAGYEHFPRWWARGLEDWWDRSFASHHPLALLSINERFSLLSQKYPGLQKLEMPRGSAGDRPWRVCSLSLEQDRSDVVPVDPEFAVRITARSDRPVWTDPQYASAAEAFRRQDPRSDENDVARLQKLLIRVPQ
ncbi:hypothetical protein [Hyphomonas chukchiensis]|uniref:Uncharacterized protein n=1 Tax=Hyphomonas chukchiensis TaxID=1280947 RepID=A0A062U0V4_9PROT|nr:hypothetical protein [Hyphomonas chukchiensis]KCZ53956.1 hypothetical protein HY30_10675 [Hyphomonas chukchiensis]